jgi:hypothetical protein
VTFTLRSAQACTGRLTGQTVSKYAVATAKTKRRAVALGSARFSLKAGKAKKIALKLSAPSHKLLRAHHRLKVQITVTLTSAVTRRTVVHRTLVLVLPRPHAHH